MTPLFQIDSKRANGGSYGSACSASQSGVALAIVVWFLAGMSLLVAGIVAQARVDTQLAQVHVARAKVVAAGDGAIQLMMADQVSAKRQTSRGRKIPQGRYQLGNLEVLVTLVPTVGLIDLNTAAPKVLAALFHMAGGQDQAQAKILADNVVKWRMGSANRSARFHAIEDLLQVAGASRTLLDAVRDYLVAGSTSRGGTNWALAPDVLLGVIRKAGLGKDDMPNGDSPSSEGGGSIFFGTVRADALVTYGDKTWLRRRWVAKQSAPGSGLPWRILRTEPPRVVET
jgi:general secretion pathway protein K